MKSARIMFVYAVFLAACGVVAFVMAPPGAHATTALLVPGVAAALMVISGLMANAFHRNRTIGMIGIHVGLVLPLVFAIAFGYCAYNTFAHGGDEKRYLAWILSVLAAGSIVALIAIALKRPPKEKRQ